ncbi:hypothetical protein A2U01_0102234, partial [Trifolium medium]|nr:hypothetical protein [Trifolium medium]
NVDAHCNDDGHWGLGWVVRKADGSCLGAATRVVRVREAIEAEVLGLEAVLQAIDQFQGQEIIIEMDANLVVQVM